MASNRQSGNPPRRRKKKKRHAHIANQQNNNNNYGFFGNMFGGPSPAVQAPSIPSRASRNRNHNSGQDENLFVDPKVQREKEERDKLKEQETGLEIRQHLRSLYEGASDEFLVELLINYFDEAGQMREDQDNITETAELCKTCYCPWDDTETLQCAMRSCQCLTQCKSCTEQWMRVRIKDEEIMPWIPCPAENCKKSMHPQHFFDLLDRPTIANFLIIHVNKIIQRNSYWVNCTNKNCKFGFLILDEQKFTLTCEICGTQQTVSRQVEEDDNLKEMLEKGEIKKCPRCKELTMKDYGICNVIQCGKCDVWWNWVNREMSNSQRDLKLRAKRQGTLWGAGELAYQQRLQQTDPQAFKRLLESNGIKYDPRYRRGAW